jgi:thioredoxin-like negative regulator of GroEL
MSYSYSYDEQLLAAGALGRAGRFDDAIVKLRQAIALLPARYEAWAGMAECEAAARRPEAALAALDGAIVRAPKLAALRCAKAAILRGSGHGEAAAALYAVALDIDPSCVEAVLGSAALFSDGGRAAEAASLLATLPTEVRTRLDVRWATARLALAVGDWDAARTEAEAILVTPGLSAQQRSEAQLLRGEAAGEQGDRTTAFAAAVAGKALLHCLYADLAASRESEAAKSLRLGEWWGAAPAAAWEPVPFAAPEVAQASAHAFILGFPRSGTTLLEQVLAGHEDVVVLEEAPTLADHYAAFLSDDDGCARLATLTAAEADVWRARYWAIVAAHGADAGGKLFVDKAPAGTLTLPLIGRLFPDARILFAVRDPRDVVLSCFRTAFQMNATTYAFTTLDDTARLYDAVMVMAAAYRRRTALALTEVRHEALLADPDAEIARIAAFLGLSHAAAMVDVAATAARRDVRTPSARQVRAGINWRGVGRWRDYAADLAPVLPTLAPWVAGFGYPD